MINYKEELNAAQYEAATTINGPLLIIAGAGSGKTRTLIYRVAYMIENGVAPESILLLTFTNAAAKEMKERAANMLDERCTKITACTYHSFCAAMLRKYGRGLVKPNFSIITATDVPNIISMTKKKNPNEYRISGFPNAKVIAGIFSTSINKSISIQKAAEEKGLDNYTYQLTHLFEDYTAYKRKKGYLDYDDLLVMFSKLLDNDAVRNIISARYKYIMIDEYQDTNNLQEKIVIKLRKTNDNVAVVGDDYQSIYAFRGSNINNIIDFPDKFNGCKKVILNTNYRSTQEILDFANSVMDEYASFGYKKEMISAGKRGEHPTVVSMRNGYDEADMIIKLIQMYHNKGISYQNMAVIERKSASSYMLENKLSQSGIAFDKMGGLKFLEHEAVLNVLAMLRCYVNYTDELAWFRILQVLAGIGETFSARIAEQCSYPDFLIENIYKKRKFYTELCDLNNFMDSIKKDEEISFYDLFFKMKNYYVSKRRKNIMEMKTDDTKRQEYFDALKAEASIIDELWRLYGEGKEKPEAMLDSIVLDEKPGKTNELEDKLTITTIHSAKGLEWDIVFILDCVEGIFPSCDESNEEEDMEELRCFYVAITRAREMLYLMCPDFVRMYNNIYGGLSTHYINVSNSDKLLKQVRMKE